VEYVPMGRIVLERYDDYNWAPKAARHQGPAHLRKITFQIMPDPTVRLGSLRTGRIDALGIVPETESERTKADTNLQMYVRPQSGSPFQLYFNQTRDPFKDKAVREAFVKSVNVPQIIKALYFGVQQRAIGNLSPTTPGFDQGLADVNGYDPEGARQVLEEAGWKIGPGGVRQKDGKQLVIDYIAQTPNREKRQDIARFVKSYAEQVGFKVNIRLMQLPQLQATTQKNDYDTYGLSLVQVDPNVMWSILGSPFQPRPGQSGFNYAHVTALDQQLKEAQAELDEDKRLQRYQDLQKEVAQQYISLPLYVPTYTMATRGLEGLRFDSEGYPIFYDVKKVG